MAAAGGEGIRCRGLRKWCSRRCEATTTVRPPGYPTVGFYCSLHGYQAPKPSMDGTMKFESVVIEAHIRRTTSFKAPEASFAEDACKRPGLLRERDGLRTVTGSDLLGYIKERKSLDDDGARSFAQRLMAQGILVGVGAAASRPGFEAASSYRIVPTAAAAGGAR